MDYTQVFKNLNTNKVKKKHSPHKAVLLLALMELFEENKITENKFVYDDSLKNKFHQVWNRFLIDEEMFQATPHLPFWFLNSDGFWHIVPSTGNQYLVQAFLQARVKISESKLKDCVSHATLDEDLYFQFSMPTSRKVFREILLSTYLYLSEETITEYLVDRNGSNSKKEESVASAKKTNNEDLKFNELNEDLQISLNIEYYTFLRDNRELRQQFKEICPSPAALYKNIAITPIKHGQLDGFFEYSYSSFLRDLSLSLMSNDYSVSFVETIDKAVDILDGITENEEESITTTPNNDSKDILISKEEDVKGSINLVDCLKQEFDVDILKQKDNKSNSVLEYLQVEIEEPKPLNRRGLPWSKEEEEQIRCLYEKGRSFEEIASIIGRTVIAVQARLSIMGVINYTYEKQTETPQEQPEQKPLQSNRKTASKEEVMTGDGFYIENTSLRCYIYNQKGERIFNASGKLKMINGHPYRIVYSYSAYTVFDLKRIPSGFMIGDKILKAPKKSSLYPQIDMFNYLDSLEDIKRSPLHTQFEIKFDGSWYDFKGEFINK